MKRPDLEALPNQAGLDAVLQQSLGTNLAELKKRPALKVTVGAKVDAPSFGNRAEFAVKGQEAGR